MERLRKMHATKLLIGEAVDGEYSDKLLPFLTAGVIDLNKRILGTTEERTLSVAKMRLTKVIGGLFRITITSKGIALAKK